MRLRAFEAVTVALPGALTVYLSFNAGGYFPGTTALVALVLAVGLALRTVLVPRPFAGAGWPLAIAGGALALFAAWVLASAAWSHAPARALVEFERVLLYLLLLLLALSILAVRPQPWEVIGMCAARESFDRRGVAALETALDLDPADWRLRYESAVVRGSVGLDPRPAARRAVRLNPHSPLARAAATRLRGDRPRDWVPRSRAMPLPAPPFP